ncbi:MIP/aquaporin family protein [Haladaptatus salinisoli]|uniref:MIP/aquaporin family protein n=1 Tax=Haladaptatus salinisoli TaxID=2884876 RepID=UPI001D0AC444|nr:MIP/aquaporin family protein [Haladaptatus salinisoli]
MAEEYWGARYVNELVGTFILILLGDGAVVVSVLTGGFDLFGVAVLWGFAVMFAVYWVGGVSEGHINPAVTIANAVWRDFPWKHVPGYVVAQIVGAFLAAATLLVTWSGYYRQFSQANNVVRGQPGSSITGMTLWTFFPNPVFAGVKVGDFNSLQEAAFLVSFPQAFFSEVVITAILVAVIFALVDDWNPVGTRTTPGVAAFLIGLLVAALVQYEAPVSMAALNPARDLGPRILGYFAGWGEIAFPGPRGGWWLPATSTTVGGIVGGGLYDFLTRRYVKRLEEEDIEPEEPSVHEDEGPEPEEARVRGGEGGGAEEPRVHEDDDSERPTRGS